MIEFFETIRSIPGAAAKIAYARAHYTPLIGQIVEDALDPSITYGITSKDVPAVSATCASAVSDWIGDTWYDTFHELLQRLSRRTLTGNAARDAIHLNLRRHAYVGGEKFRETMLAVLDRDLKMGISWKTWKSEVLGITAKFEVALAQHLEKVNGVNPIDGSYFASRKMDGMRCIAIVDCDEGTVEFRSRQNKKILTLENLKPAILRFCSGLKGAYVLDGELCKVDENGDEDFQAIMKEARRKDYSLDDCCYQVFDILTYDEFCRGESKTTLSDRLYLLITLNQAYTTTEHERCWVRPTPQERIHSQDDFDRWTGYVEKGNWEGFMLRKDVPYKSGRTKDLLKAKKFFDAEYTVEGVECGRMVTALPGQGNVEFEGVTRLIIRHNGNEVGVGAGLSREQRIAWMNDPSLIVGKVVTIKYFETTVAQDGKESLRFPTLKHVYENGRDC